ncbi:hypothetical protein ABN154_07460 [Klebsiella michiganensis]|uniref:hypothetical protein n=1 Tax=Klebsiella michiganensis TaxID=1134687 RepID=UPI0005388661|nr:hypothetical protein MC47_001910 [Citrobacter freundii]
MKKKRKIVLLGMLGIVSWGYYNYTTNKAYMETPEYKDKKARSFSIDYGRVVRSETGRKFFESYECTGDCSGHIAGYEWAQDREVTEDYCFSLEAPRSFQEGCAGEAGRQRIAREESKAEAAEYRGNGSRRWE